MAEWADFPHLISELHPTKNVGLMNYGKPIAPMDLGLGSNKKLWWKCPHGPDHEWSESLRKRAFENYGCPFCSGKKLSVTNSLAAKSPELSKQFHPTKNGNLTPETVKGGGHQKVWWKCYDGTWPDGSFADDHEWDATIKSRMAGSGCPCCVENGNKKVVSSNCLAAHKPKVAAMWHPTKNGSLTPNDVSPASNNKAHFICSQGHELHTMICNKSDSCGICDGWGPNAYTQEEWIEKATKKHNGYYDYSRVKYIDSHTKVTIGCPKHGWFEQGAQAHSGGGRGCRECGLETMKQKQTLDCSEWIERFIEKHGDRYDYSKVEETYVSSKLKVTIGCSEHGWIEQTPQDHFKAKIGCFECGHEHGINQIRTTWEEYHSRFVEIHADYYDYSKAKESYINSTTKIPIGCPEHGWFEQTPHEHSKGKGCNDCGVESAREKMTLDPEVWRQRMDEAQPDYDHSQSIIVNGHTKTNIICPVGHEILQDPDHHIRGRGCRHCAEHGFQYDEPAYYYVYRIVDNNNNTICYKAGITKDLQSRGSNQRRSLQDDLKMVFEDVLYFELGKDAWDLEQYIIKIAEQDGWKAESLDFDGGTEVFVHNPIDFLNSFDYKNGS